MSLPCIGKWDESRTDALHEDVTLIPWPQSFQFLAAGSLGRDGISSAIYVTASGRRVVVLKVFVKKTQKTPEEKLILLL